MAVKQLPLWVLRVWHWITAALFSVLVVTGAVLHYATPGFEPIGYAAADAIHVVTGMLLAVGYAIFVVLALARGYWRKYIPSRKELWARLKARLALRGAGGGRSPPQDAERLNAPERLAYLLVVFVIVPLIVITGVLYMYPERAPQLLGLPALWPLAIAHHVAGLLGTVFLIVHVYLRAAPTRGT